MNKTIIVHTHFRGGGGIGDFIRAALSFYSLCKRYDYEYYISFEENPILKKCFIYKKLPDEYINHDKCSIKIEQRDIILNEDIFINQAKNNINKVIYLYSNAIGIEKSEYINLIKEDFLNNILKPSKSVQDYIDLTYANLNITNNNYLSVHIRCGDKYIETDNKGYNSKDSRINMDDLDLYNKYNNCIQKFKNDYDINLPILIHSDSNLFKKKLININNEYKILDINISHISENTGATDENSYIATIAEFYILSNANMILSPYTYSGFSHIGSFINNKKLYTSLHHFYYNLINSNNIVYL